jgi:hypothetical protein
MNHRRRLFLILSVLLLAVAGWVAWRAWRAASEARLALAALDRIQAAADNPSMEAADTVAADVAALEVHLTAARAAARPFLAVAPAFGGLPRVGPLAESGPVLLDLAVEVAAGGNQALAALRPALTALQAEGGEEGLGQVVTVLEAASPELAAADARLAHAEELRASLSDAIPTRFQGQLAQLDRILPLARAALQGAQVAPALLGADGPRTYLILAQNSDEMRPTGGFISAVGVVRFEEGRIADLKLADSYAVDNFQQPHPLPPLPLSEQMGAQLLLLRDSNWSPDFPTSAEVARALYAQDQGVETDGAIALDLEAVRLLVAALGPLDVTGIEGPVTGDNVLVAMRRAWEAPAAGEGTVVQAETSDWWVNRKDFMGDLVSAALEKLQGGADLDATALARAVLAMLEGRHLQAAVDDPTLAALLASQGWDGALRPQSGRDFLAVIDSNVGFNKASAAVRAALDYTVTNRDGRLESTLVLKYVHAAPPLPADQPCDRTPRYGTSYDEMVRRCYWDYLRIYVPEGSELVSSQGLERMLVEPGENGTDVIQGVFVLRPGDSHTIRLVYRPSENVALLPYVLMVRKQAGTPPWPLRVSTGRCHWETTLETDRLFTCPVGVE